MEKFDKLKNYYSKRKIIKTNNFIKIINNNINLFLLEIIMIKINQFNSKYKKKIIKLLYVKIFKTI